MVAVFIVTIVAIVVYGIYTLFLTPNAPADDAGRGRSRAIQH
jgi:hypothetical protein